MPELGRLKKVSPRIAWETEDRHFTPWLAQPENLALLGEAIGIELELEAQEKSVGPFRADILCKDTATDNWVLIENQLARTDHTHLGQLITYAAGLKAVTIVWIAEPFTEEHRAALDWLNEITDHRFNFFGLEVELWQIGDSRVAPKFNIAAQPNDWSKTVAEGVASVEKTDLTESKQLQLDYWVAFREYVKRKDSHLRLPKPSARHWMNLSLGRGGFRLCAVASVWSSKTGNYDEDEIRSQVDVYGPNAERYFQLIEEERETIEEEFGDDLVWHNPVGATVFKIISRKSVDLKDRDDWENQMEWLLRHLERMHLIFSERIKSLSLD